MGNSWLGRIIVDRTVDHSGGIHHSGSHRVEAAHGSQITNFRLGRGLPSETGDGWVAWPHRPTPIVLVGSGWIGYPRYGPMIPL